MEKSSVIANVTGSAVVVRGGDIDTDRIIPARYLRTVTFENLGEHVFEDDRAQGDHPFNEERYQGASILLANANFGCGSSREHAPQALTRWGINAFVGESFAEIFYGNCIAMGLPCLRVSAEDMQTLMAAVESNPAQELVVDLEARKVRYAGGAVAADIADGPREQFIKGSWDSLGQLLDAGDQIGETAAGLPYTNGFAVAG
ncbi:MAG TPA: 3-isopropylmalate dehydratase small subunit [Candidatus Latescibacteria bacterium]|nr:3-isopropylmalate dehydratase small subunit [Candidatus Handelsmanbacteria bacterium]HIL09120.1 3-isopropylmalate dehydratase small subunit [Candidatus Latescibacterota bacterium]